LLTPAVGAQVVYYRQLGHRNRVLELVVIIVAVLMLLWQVPSVYELAQMLARENLFWFTQQAIDKK
jgi:hypothetical protein